MMHKEEMKESEMEGMMNWWEHLSEDKMKAKLDMKMKKVQAYLGFPIAEHGFSANSGSPSYIDSRLAYRLYG
jgi:hypothetical protein